MLKVVKFQAEWCGPCKTLTPIWNVVADNFDDVEFEVIDIDLDPDTTAKYSVRAVPTIVFVGCMVGKLFFPCCSTCIRLVYDKISNYPGRGVTQSLISRRI